MYENRPDKRKEWLEQRKCWYKKYCNKPCSVCGVNKISAWNKNNRCRSCYSKTRKGIIPNNFKIAGWFRGKKRGKEFREKISKALTGIKRPYKPRPDRIGSFTGKNNPKWKGGISKINPREYKTFLQGRRRARKRKNGGNHTLEQWIELKKMNAYLCNNCGNMEPFIKLTEDHIIPISKGGSDNIENIQPLCLSCNCKKQAKLPDFIIK